MFFLLLMGFKMGVAHSEALRACTSPTHGLSPDFHSPLCLQHKRS